MRISDLRAYLQLLIFSVGIETKCLAIRLITTDNTTLIQSLIRDIHTSIIIPRRIGDIMLDAETILIKTLAAILHESIRRHQIITILRTIIQGATNLDHTAIKLRTILLVLICGIVIEIGYAINVIRMTSAKTALEFRQIGNRIQRRCHRIGNARFSFLTRLGRHEQDTIRGLRTIQGGSGSALQHRDVIDIIRVKGLQETNWGLHAIQHQQGGVIALERTGTTQGNTGLLVERGRSLADLQARDLTTQRQSRVRALRHVQRLVIHLGGRVTDRFRLTLDTQCRHDNLVQLLRIRL